MMSLLLGFLAFVVFTFPFAYLWHLKIFRAQYEKWQYFAGEAQPALGLAAIVVQGLILSFAYQHFRVIEWPMLNSVVFSGVMLVFLWSSHVLSTMAKSKETRNWHFFWMETTYLVIQFGVFGCLLGIVQGAFS